MNPDGASMAASRSTARAGALGEITLPCSENVVRSLLKHCYGLPYDANLSLEDELEPWHLARVFDLYP